MDNYKVAKRFKDKGYTIEGIKFDGTTETSNQQELKVRQGDSKPVKIAELKQEIIDHFNSENTILENVKSDIDSDNYRARKAEIKRQKFYMMLIVSKFTA